jgi:hypothetical protein
MESKGLFLISGEQQRVSLSQIQVPENTSLPAFCLTQPVFVSDLTEEQFSASQGIALQIPQQSLNQIAKDAQDLARKDERAQITSKVLELEEKVEKEVEKKKKKKLDFFKKKNKAVQNQQFESTLREEIDTLKNREYQ